MHEATQRLLELGLSDKEASVYLALLELGSSVVQDISEKAGVNRTTTYATIESLQRHGLVSMVTEGKKVLYAATSPQHLESILHKERLEIDTKKQKLNDALPLFMALYNAVERKPVIRFFEGEEGMTAIREILADSTGEYLSFTAIDEGTMRVGKMNEEQRQRMARRMRGRYIFSLKPGCARPKTDLKNWQVREIPYEASPFTGEINIVGDKVGATVVKDVPMGFVVESAELAGMFRAFFNTAWAAAKPV